MTRYLLDTWCLLNTWYLETTWYVGYQVSLGYLVSDRYWVRFYCLCLLNRKRYPRGGLRLMSRDATKQKVHRPIYRAGTCLSDGFYCLPRELLCLCLFALR